MRLNSRVEIVKLDSRPNQDGYRSVQIAVDGELSWPFDLHEADWAQMAGDEAKFADYLETCALTLIRRYGDARKVRIREDGQVIPLYGEAETATAGF